MKRLSRSRTSMSSAALAEPVTASHSGAQNRSRIEVRARNCRIPAGCWLSTSSARKSTTNRLSPVNCWMTALGDGREIDTCGPAFCPAGQIRQIGLAEFDPGDVGDKLSHLCRPEVQFSCPDLG